MRDDALLSGAAGWTSTVGRGAVLVGLGAAALWAVQLEHTVCPFANLAGYPCPGCGMTRAALALLRGDIAAALSLHPLSLVCVPIATLVLLLGAWSFVLGTPSTWPNRLRRRIPPRVIEAFWWSLAALFVAVWVVRFAGGMGGPVSVNSLLSLLKPE